jgi:hypothetical protein
VEKYWQIAAIASGKAMAASSHCHRKNNGS